MALPNANGQWLNSGAYVSTAVMALCWCYWRMTQEGEARHSPAANELYSAVGFCGSWELVSRLFISFILLLPRLPWNSSNHTQNRTASAATANNLRLLLKLAFYLLKWFQFGFAVLVIELVVTTLIVFPFWLPLIQYFSSIHLIRLEADFYYLKY